MLPKKNRAGTKEITTIFKEGNFMNSPNFSFRYLKTNGTETKISFIAPKNIAKSAVKRNFLRRRGYSAMENLKKNIKLFPIGITGAFIFKKYQDDVFVISHEIKSILNKIN